ncbi:hypothetical protein HDU93_010026 [Gonapodya sp. JEL0774]|nr:hypothetical protein HDU93_010026 [Gonapodya sp. JEL0774]
MAQDPIVALNKLCTRFPTELAIENVKRHQHISDIKKYNQKALPTAGTPVAIRDTIQALPAANPGIPEVPDVPALPAPVDVAAEVPPAQAVPHAPLPAPVEVPPPLPLLLISEPVLEDGVPPHILPPPTAAKFAGDFGFTPLPNFKYSDEDPLPSFIANPALRDIEAKCCLWVTSYNKYYQHLASGPHKLLPESVWKNMTYGKCLDSNILQMATRPSIERFGTIEIHSEPNPKTPI